VYCVGGMGRGVGFWKFKQGDQTEIKPMDVYRNEVRIRDSGVLPTIYDIADGPENIRMLIEYIRRNPPS
jgi:hypothetical protein